MTGTDAALEGIRILDLTHGLYGPLTTQLLGDAGADVIKVEPPWGDFTRVSREGHGEDASMWLAVNRSKRSLSIDLTTDRGKDVIRQLVPSCDVMIHSFRPGVIERLGLDFESVRALNDRIVHVSLSGYGTTGPMGRWAGGDMWAQAFGGVVATQGTEGAPPYMAGVAFMDHGGAALAAFAVMAALRRRDATGEAQEIGSSLLDTVLFMQAGQVGDYLIDGHPMLRTGRGWRGGFPYGAYTASDGDVVIIHGSDDTTWKTLVALLGIEHLLDDPRYGTVEQRVELKADLYPILDAAFAKKTRAEWQALFFAEHLRCDPCLTYAELFAHPQTIATEIVLESERPPLGTMRTIGVPYTVGGERPRPERVPPQRNEHSVEVLREFGFDAATIQSLIEDNVVFQDDGPPATESGGAAGGANGND